MRRSQDIAVRALRQLVLVYMRQHEDVGAFQMRAMHVVRLYVEEAFHRCLLSLQEPLRKSGLCNLMLTMRNFEVATLPVSHLSMSIWQTFNGVNVRAIAERVRRFETLGEASSIEAMPSFVEAMMNHDLRIEIISLIPVKVSTDLVTLSREEVRAAIEANGGHVEEAEAVGGCESSVFSHTFQG